MAELHQKGGITTLHNLVGRPLAELEKELLAYAKHRPMSLVVAPSSSAAAWPALADLSALKHAPYLSEIIVGLDLSDRSDFRHALDCLRPLSQHHRVIWTSSPRMRGLDEQLSAKGLIPPEGGQERSTWYCLGYLLAVSESEAIALHSSDGISCQRTLLAKLFYPLVSPALSFEFCKAYRGHASAVRPAGHTERLLITPLLRALAEVFGPSEYLKYLESFHSPLANEVAFRRKLIGDWHISENGLLQLGLLSELQTKSAANSICQMDINDALSRVRRVPIGGSRAAMDQGMQIAKVLFEFITSQGLVVDSPTIQTVKLTYQQAALDFVQAYRNDNLANGLSFDIHQEEQAVEHFSEDIYRAGKALATNPGPSSPLPSWNRAISAVPDILAQLHAAVESDHREFANPAAFISCTRPSQGSLSASA